MTWHRCLSRIVGAAALGSALVFTGATRGQLPEDVLFRDLWHTAQARKILQSDPQLGPLNIGVRVTGGVALLWGPVPSADLAYRAEQRLRPLFELIEVRNTLTVDTDGVLEPPAPPSSLEQFAPATPREPRRPLLEPSARVALAGIAAPEETLTARSSPLTRNPSPVAITLRMPFLGTIALPR